MMKPQSNGLVELHDAKRKERGFNCMQLIWFLTKDGVKEWEYWHGAHLEAAAGQCRYKSTMLQTKTQCLNLLSSADSTMYSDLLSMTELKVNQ